VKQYNAIRKSGKKGTIDNLGERGENKKSSILSRYMEDENGEGVLEDTREATRMEAKGFFELLLENG
jgi:hypothetical protein